MAPFLTAKVLFLAAALAPFLAAISTASTEIEEAVSKWFISQEERYRLKGDRESLKRIEASREAFTSKGKLPQNLPTSLQRKQELVHNKMEAAYVLALRDFTREKNDNLAMDTERQLVEFRKNHQITRRQVWKHEGGVFAAIGDGIWEETDLTKGKSYRFREINRTEDFVELDAITGDTNTRVRLYDERADYGYKPTIVFKKGYEGQWSAK